MSCFIDKQFITFRIIQVFNIFRPFGPSGIKHQVINLFITERFHDICGLLYHFGEYFNYMCGMI